EYLVNSSNPNSMIEYVYSADGTKLRQISLDATSGLTKLTDYVTGFQYEDEDISSGSGHELKHFAHEEGRIRKNGNNFE
ncbi:MAG: hypothetical protein AAF804_12825, partial [Bacteroidota bacterium]